MSQRQLVKVLTPKEGYNILAKKYKTFYKYFDSFDAGSRQRYLPRKMIGKTMLDIGAGDGRVYNYVKNYEGLNFVAIDISDQILKQHPQTKNITKKITDLEESWDIDDESIDVLTAFFVIDYLQDLSHLALEIFRVLKKGGIAIIGYFPKRKSTVYKSKDGEFKIMRKVWMINDIIGALEYEYLKVTCNDIIDNNGILLGYHIICEKT